MHCSYFSRGVNVRASTSASSTKLGVVVSGLCVPYKYNDVWGAGYYWRNVNYQGRVISGFLSFVDCTTASFALVVTHMYV